MSLAKRIIPCLDVDGGRVVKGTRFVSLKDAGDPVELAKRYDEEGADELVFLDITATSDKRRILREFVAKTAEQLFIPFTVGGGISDLSSIRDLLLAGADKVSINTAAVFNPAFVRDSAAMFGSQCIVLAMDVKQINEQKEEVCLPVNGDSALALDANSAWQLYTHGGRKATGIDALKWATYMTELGVGEILLTSMDRDGTESGYDLLLLSAISQAVSVPVIASGGAGHTSHVVEALSVCDAALLASMLHFRKTSIHELKLACQKADLSVRII